MTDDEKMEVQAAIGHWFDSHGWSFATEGDLSEDGGMAVHMTWSEAAAFLAWLKEAGHAS